MAQSQSPLTKGKVLLLGNAGFNSNLKDVPQVDKTNTTRQKEWQATLGIGYLLSNRWVIGLLAGYGSQKETIESKEVLSRINDQTYIYVSNSTDQQQSTNIGVFAQWYQPASDKIILFIQPSVQFRTQRYSYENGYYRGRYMGNNERDVIISEAAKQGGSLTGISYKIAIEPGIMYFFTPKMAGTLTIGQIAYTINRTSQTADKTWGNSFDLNILPATLADVRLGLQLYF